VFSGSSQFWTVDYGDQSKGYVTMSLNTVEAIASEELELCRYGGYYDGIRCRCNIHVITV